MSLLCPFAFPVGAWCRRADRAGCWVLWFPFYHSLPVGFAPWFLGAGGALLASAACGEGTALLLALPAWAGEALAAVVPPPVSHGSRTAGVLLPW